VEPVAHQIASFSLWNTIKHIITVFADENEYIVICEDDHSFTKEYSENMLMTLLEKASNRGADILLGGVSWFQDAVQVSTDLFWTNKFSGTQFIVVFKGFFERLITAEFDKYDTVDFIISSISNKVFFAYPFISVQKDFGYSDVTFKNNIKGRVEELFIGTFERLSLLKKIALHYDRRRIKTTQKELNKITIPTYIINLVDRTERLYHIQEQFVKRNEFDVTIVEAEKHIIGAVGLWLSIRKVIQIAEQKEEDVVIICEDDHEFTEQYTVDYLLTNIIEAHQQGVDYLSGGASTFENALKIAPNRYWVGSCRATQFIIIFRKFFRKILDEPFDNTIIADIRLSEMTSNKMILYPGISVQKDFGYSDVTAAHSGDKNLVSNMFMETRDRLKKISLVYENLASLGETAKKSNGL